MYKARTLLLAHLPNHKEELLLLKVHPVLQITSGSALYVSAFPTAYQVPTKGKKDQSIFKKARYLLEKAPFLFLKDHYLFEKALALFTKRLCLFGSTQFHVSTYEPVRTYAQPYTYVCEAPCGRTCKSMLSDMK